MAADCQLQRFLLSEENRFWSTPGVLESIIKGVVSAHCTVTADSKANNITLGASRKYIESHQAATTIPFGCDDVSDTKMLADIAVSSFNQLL
ncbi:hypothetical protein OS493_023921 [Desmophyllum pertusum]|uniref:Uncharacterized protein n=1 Tax=Desmophyllum pertusum TaxID=174260 RepID=A0A9W9YDP5_9CNID|nr:hypothetical protein OS493_023921 [Desmophyllum pertusum]